MRAKEEVIIYSNLNSKPILPTPLTPLSSPKTITDNTLLKKKKSKTIINEFDSDSNNLSESQSQHDKIIEEMYEKPKRKKTKSNASPPKTQERESCYNFDEE